MSRIPADKSQGTELNLVHLRPAMILMHDRELSYGARIKVSDWNGKSLNFEKKYVVGDNKN